MTSADALPEHAPRSVGARARRADAGFTLVEMLLAFAILAVTMAYMMQAQTSALLQGGKARDLRDIRVMSDTVFRKAIYEIWQWQDGQSSTADQWYGDFARLKGAQRDQWRPFRLVFHKTKKMAAGTDPTGKVESLDGDALYGDRTGSGTTTGTTTGSSETASGAGTADGTSSGEAVYVVSLEVYTTDDESTPQLTLRTMVPVPEIELEQDR